MNPVPVSLAQPGLFISIIVLVCGSCSLVSPHIQLDTSLVRQRLEAWGPWLEWEVRTSTGEAYSCQPGDGIDLDLGCGPGDVVWVLVQPVFCQDESRTALGAWGWLGSPASAEASGWQVLATTGGGAAARLGWILEENQEGSFDILRFGRVAREKELDDLSLDWPRVFAALESLSFSALAIRSRVLVDSGALVWHGDSPDLNLDWRDSRGLALAAAEEGLGPLLFSGLNVLLPGPDPGFDSGIWLVQVDEEQMEAVGFRPEPTAGSGD